MMELLQKFAAVEVQPDCRISGMGKDYCERQTQQELLGASKSLFYHNHLGRFETPFTGVCGAVCYQIPGYGVLMR